MVTDQTSNGLTAWMPSIRRIHNSGSLRISFASGQLALASLDDNIYHVVGGAAVVVYNDDGTLPTG